MQQPYDVALDALSGLAYQSALEIVEHTPAGSDPPTDPMIDRVYAHKKRESDQIRAQREAAKRKG